MHSIIRIDVINRSENKVAHFYIDKNVFEQIRPALDQTHEEEILKQICKSEFGKINNQIETRQYIHRIIKTPDKSKSSYTLLNITSSTIEHNHLVEIHNYNYETIIYHEIPESQIQDFLPMIKKSEAEFLPGFIEKSYEDYFSGKISVKKQIDTPTKRALNRNEHGNELYSLALSAFEISDGQYIKEIKKISKLIQEYQQLLTHLETTIIHNHQLAETYQLEKPDFNEFIQIIHSERARVTQIFETVKDPQNLLVIQSESYYQNLEELNFLKKMFAAKIYGGIQEYFELMHQKGSDATNAKKNSKGKAKEKIYSNALSKDFDEFNQRLQPINIRISQLLKLSSIDDLYRHFTSEKMTLEQIAKAISSVLTNCKSIESKAFQEISSAIEEFNQTCINSKYEFIHADSGEKPETKLQAIKKCSITTTPSSFMTKFVAIFKWHENLLEFENDVQTKCNLIKEKMKGNFTETLFKDLQSTIKIKEIEKQINEALKNLFAQAKTKIFSEFKQLIDQTLVTLSAYEKEAITEVQSISIDDTELPASIKINYDKICMAKHTIEEKIKLAEDLNNQFEQEMTNLPATIETLQHLLENNLKDIRDDIAIIINTVEVNLQALTNAIVQKRTELLKKQKEDEENNQYASEVELVQSIRQLNRESMRQSIKICNSAQKNILPKTSLQNVIKTETQAEIDKKNHEKRILDICTKLVTVIQDKAYWKEQLKYKPLVRSQGENHEKIPCGINKMMADIKLHTNWKDNPKILLRDLLVIIFERMRVSQHNIKYSFWGFGVRKRTTTGHFYRGTLLLIDIDLKKHKKISSNELQKLIVNKIEALTDKQITELIQHFENFGSETLKTKNIKQHHGS